jgi:hypothetical protein
VPGRRAHCSSSNTGSRRYAVSGNFDSLGRAYLTVEVMAPMAVTKLAWSSLSKEISDRLPSAGILRFL